MCHFDKRTLREGNETLQHKFSHKAIKHVELEKRMTMIQQFAIPALPTERINARSNTTVQHDLLNPPWAGALKVFMEMELPCSKKDGTLSL